MTEAKEQVPAQEKPDSLQITIQRWPYGARWKLSIKWVENGETRRDDFGPEHRTRFLLKWSEVAEVITNFLYPDGKPPA